MQAFQFGTTPYAIGYQALESARHCSAAPSTPLLDAARSQSTLPPASYRVQHANDPLRFKQNRDSNARWKLTKDVVSIVVFPIILYKLLIQYTQRNYSYKLFPACDRRCFATRLQTERATDRIITKIMNFNAARENFLADITNRAFQQTLEAADGISFDSVKIMSGNRNNKWVLFCQGNSTCFEDELLHKMKQVSDDTGANILIFNHRSVGRGRPEDSPRHSNHLVLDASAAMQYLLEVEGAEPRNIVLHGWSMGGAVAARVAGYYQTPGNEVSLILDRTYTTLQNVIMTRYNYVVGRALSLLSIAGGWDFDNEEALKKITGNVVMIYSPVDPTIPKEAGIYGAFKRSKMSAEDIRDKKQRQVQKRRQAEEVRVEEGTALLQRVAAYKPCRIKLKALPIHPDAPVRNKTIHSCGITDTHGDDYAEYILQVKRLLRIEL